MDGRRCIGPFPALVVSLVLSGAASVALAAADGHASNSRGPTGYRGIVAADFHSARQGEEIVGDFGALGVWILQSGVWTQLTTDNPEWIFAVKRHSAGPALLVGDFGPKGVWDWEYGGTWKQLSTASPDGGLAVDDDQDGNEEAQIDFGSLGLWRYDLDTSAWRQLTAENPSNGLRTDMWEPGWEEGLWDFDGDGLWRVQWISDNPSWLQLTASNPSEDWSAANFVDDGADPEDELVVEFAGLGTWLYDSNGGAGGGAVWTRIAYGAGVAVVAARTDAAGVSQLFLADGVDKPLAWLWSRGAWRNLSTSSLDAGFAVPFDADGLQAGEPAIEEELAADFGPLGLWLYNHGKNGVVANEWKMLTAANPIFMVGADHFGDGLQTMIVVSFGPGVGLWWYDSRVMAHPWNKLTDSIPDSSIGWSS